MLFRSPVTIGSYHVFVKGGREDTGLDAISWAKEVESRGAGEILLTSMDTDGLYRDWETRTDETRLECQKTEYAISIAKSGRKDMVHICDSHSGGHSSNREPVATAISTSAARLGWPHGPELRSTKETNFNGYDIWKQGQTRLVWSV